GRGDGGPLGPGPAPDLGDRRGARRRRLGADPPAPITAHRTMLSVVVPVYNERESLATLHAELVRAMAAGGHDPVEFIFIDDGSRAGSWDVAAEPSRSDPRVRGIRLRRNFGKAAALTAGFEAARGSLVFTLDGDLQDDPAEVPKFLAKLDQGLDIV